MSTRNLSSLATRLATPGTNSSLRRTGCGTRLRPLLTINGTLGATIEWIKANRVLVSSRMALVFQAMGLGSRAWRWAITSRRVLGL